MKLTWQGLQNRKAWEDAGIGLPSYDIRAAAEKGKQSPVWAHFGIGNIFRIFIGSIADRLMEEGKLDAGLTCVETFDFDIVRRICRPCDNLALAVYLNNDGTKREKVFGCFAEAIEANSRDQASWQRMKEVFASPSLQMVSFTITEKGYALKDSDGLYFDAVREDFAKGPEQASCAMSVVAAMLYARYKAGAVPLALVSMDNCSHNGENLRNAVLETARKWQENGFADAGFLAYVSDEARVSFPWTMIDKITPRPSEAVRQALEEAGVEDMDTVVTGKSTYIAPFVNAEEPQYLVIEDRFPNGRPPLELAGVFMTDRETVDKAERMKVMACLNPIHSALAPYGMMLGMNLFADTLNDPQLQKLAHLVGETEGMEFAEEPGIISPKAFLEEVLDLRFPNPYLGDTTARILTDESQGLAIRFGETIKACVKKYGSAGRLKGIALALAGWLRYVLAVDDRGKLYTLSPDPLAPVYHEALSGIRIGAPETAGELLKPILSNEHVFGVNLYAAGIGETVETVFKEEIAGQGAVRAALIRYLG